MSGQIREPRNVWYYEAFLLIYIAQVFWSDLRLVAAPATLSNLRNLHKSKMAAKSI